MIKNMTNLKWDLSDIKEGIDRYIHENGRPPTARDFDASPYLPSARQIQRSYGGMATLRAQLGYKDLDFTKGELRKSIATEASKRGIAAEEYLEPLLISHFGEPFVHTQKRYAKGTKNRYDFFIYAQNVSIGVDVFTTSKLEYIGVNVRHKVHKYKQLQNIETYFVLVGTDYSIDDMINARNTLPILRQYNNLHLLSEKEFLQYIQTLKPLQTPDFFRSISI